MDEISLMLPTTSRAPPNGDYKYVDRGSMGEQMYGHFSNGYGASIVRGPYTYGGPSGEYELAVLHGGTEVGDGSLCYATSVTDDVLGWLSENEIIGKLHEIVKLPTNNDCDHTRPDEWDPFEHKENQGRRGSNIRLLNWPD